MNYGNKVCDMYQCHESIKIIYGLKTTFSEDGFTKTHFWTFINVQKSKPKTLSRNKKMQVRLNRRFRGLF